MGEITSPWGATGRPHHRLHHSLPAAERAPWNCVADVKAAPSHGRPIPHLRGGKLGRGWGRGRIQRRDREDREVEACRRHGRASPRAVDLAAEQQGRGRGAWGWRR